MKSLLLIFGILTVVVSIQSVLLNNGTIEEIKKIQKDCMDDLGITEELMVISDLKTRVIKMNCLMACTASKNGVMMNDKYIPDKIWTKMKEYYPNIEESVKEKIIKCAGIANEKSDKCEVADAFKMCATENGIMMDHRN